ncbi:MAG: hypothetical protein AB1644_07275 [Candidatus Zixiibacteriota bacterium]
MRSSVNGALILLVVLAGTAMVQAGPVDKFGKADTVYAEIASINPTNWSITISYSNDESVLALSVPLKMTAGLNRIVADSAVYTGGRCDHFAYKAFRADTAIQCVLVGMIANIGPTKNKLKPGTGRLATIYVSSLEDKPIEKLAVDTTTMHPNNSLMAVADALQGEPPDTTRVDRKDIEIIPVFVAKQSK